jgi:hypothetical protein
VSGMTLSANTLTLTNYTGGTVSTNIGGINRWFISSGETITIDSFYQSFVYGDVVVEGTLDIKENSQLVIINGDLINSGGTIVQSGDTYLIDLPLVDTSVDSFVYSNNTFTITDNFGETYSAVLNVLTGLTVNGNFSATTISGDTFYGNGANLTGIKPYKVYTALLTQSGSPTNDPTAIVLENTLTNNVTITRNSPGNYSITCSDFIDITKVYVELKNINVLSSITPSQYCWFTVNSGSIVINTTTINLITSSITPTDFILNNTPIEIRVYN